MELGCESQELIINLAPAAALYKKLVESTDYAGDVPIMHQAVVLKAAIDASGRIEAGRPDRPR